LDEENLERTLRLILRELRRIGDEPPGASELRRARDYLIGQIDLSLESTDNQMNWVGEQLIGYGRVFLPEESKRRLAAVRPAELQAMAKEFLRPDRSNMALISPMRSSKHVTKMLEQASR
jgi:predicted Zn-dependent peptidase